MAEKFVTRRRILNSIVSACTVMPFVARATPLNYEFTGPAADLSLELKPPLACTPGTRRQSEGPFYTPQTPNRSNLKEPDTQGETLILEGLVLTPDCQPVAGAVIDFWHCDEKGRYDNSGFRYRGHQFTDAAGGYQCTTIRPRHYFTRTPHIHVKLQGPETKMLTTQVYFPDHPNRNALDWIFREELLMQLEQIEGVWHGRFDFVLPPA